MKFLVTLVCVLALNINAYAHDGSEPTDINDFQKCEKVMSQLDRLTDLDLISDCQDFYWHNGNYDIGFNKQVLLGKRFVTVSVSNNELDENTINEITSVSWLLWSKWVTWSKNPENMPDGQGKDDEAFNYVQSFKSLFKGNFKFFLDAGTVLWPVAKQYQPARFAVIIDLFLEASKLASTKAEHIRIRLNLGHCYRQSLQKDLALEWYKKVLEVDPENVVALREIDQLQKP